MWSQLFLRKPYQRFIEEMESDNRLRRVLGPVSLASLGIGSTVGAGIFVLVGLAAHDKAGPALILSFVVSGIACVFAALAYAEFASMVPVAGSTYTYAYATMGEIFAWIIGWDLVLEYAVAASTVANGWSEYMKSLLSRWTFPLKNFLAVLLESGRVPARIVCMHRGVWLTTAGSPLADLLKNYEAAGTEILSCGTCLEYYQRQDQLIVGKPTTMRETVAAMLSFPKVITW